jgi:hypothetical protein
MTDMGSICFSLDAGTIELPPFGAARTIFSISVTDSLIFSFISRIILFFLSYIPELASI